MRYVELSELLVQLGRGDEALGWLDPAVSLLRGSVGETHRYTWKAAEMQTYGADLRAMTQGKGSFTMELHGYEELPAHLQEKVVAAGRGERLEEEDED